jgi:hypothetical protein
LFRGQDRPVSIIDPLHEWMGPVAPAPDGKTSAFVIQMKNFQKKFTDFLSEFFKKTI